MPTPALFAAFPGLADDDAVITHDADRTFNCVAWVAGDTSEWWWPGDESCYWPAGVPREPTVEAVTAALSTVGYAVCDGGEYTPGFEKAAVYALGDTATHVAKQLPGGRWSSKLGRGVVVSHASPGGLEGAFYGTVAAYLRRPALTPPP